MITAKTYRARALWMVAALFCIRLLALILSPYGLHGDEAQYWSWAQDLDWGYFSKPPMIAWIIAATTQVFGDAEWAVRLGSALLHCASALLIYAAGAKAFTSRAGFWAAAIYSLMPGVWVSSMIISTDAALLFFYALALYAWLSLREQPAWRYILLLGAAIGFGVMSKYAMAFFIPPLLLALIIDPPTRRALAGVKGLAVAGLATLIIAPNIYWNISHDFATLTHTAANTNLEGKTVFFHPLEFLQFFRDQFGVFGPMPFILLLGALAIAIRHAKTIPNGRLLYLLAVFAAVPLLVISAQAFLSRANANWAVSAYVSAALLLAVLSQTRTGFAKWLPRGLLMQGLFCGFLLSVSLIPAAVDSLKLTNSVKRLRAWPQTLSAVQTRFEDGHETKGFSAIVFDSRLMFYNMQYYGRQTIAPNYIWQEGDIPKNHAQLTAALPKLSPPAQGNDTPLLFIQSYSDESLAEIKPQFTRFAPLAPITIELGGGKTRELKTWAAYGYTP